MKYILSIIFVWILFPLSAQTIHKGTLENGLTYYLVKTDHPTINFYLIQNIGASLEQPHQRGYAHFLEHLSFYGSKNFPQGTLRFIKSHKITNGASTYKDKIVYSLKGVDPRRTSIDSCVMMLHDWGSCLAFDAAAVDAERKIITEESRSDQRQRMSKEMIDLLYNGSALGITSCLGDLNVVQNATVESLRQFYSEWFKPNVQAVCIEGNIDVQQCEKLLAKAYADIKLEVCKRPEMTIPDNDSIYSKVYNNQSPVSSCEIVIRLKDYSFADKTDYIRRGLYAELYNLALRSRLANFDYKQRNHLKNWTLNRQPLDVGYKLETISFVSNSSADKECLQQIVRNHNILINSGLCGQEASLYIQNIAKSSELYSNYDAYSVIENNFLSKTPLYSHEDVKRVADQLLINFDNADFAAFCASYFNLKNSLIVAQLGANTNFVSEKDFRKSLTDTRSEINVDTNQNVSFASVTLAPSSAVYKKSADKIHHFKLASGLEIFYVESSEDSIKVRGFAPGGTSAVDKREVLLAENLPTLMNFAGIDRYDFNDIELYKKNNAIQLEFSVDTYFNRVQAVGSKEHAGNFFDLLQRKLTSSLCDQKALDFFIEKAEYADQTSRKDRVAQEIKRSAYGVDPRQSFFSKSFFVDYTPDSLTQRLTKVYNNGANWCYVIESPIPLDEFKTKYLPYFEKIQAGESRQKCAVSRRLQLKKNIRKQLSAGSQNQLGGVEYTIFLASNLSTQEELALNLLQYVVKNRCIEEFRNKNSALYGMFTKVQREPYPENNHSLYINFGAASSNIIKFADYINEQFADVAKNNITNSELEMAKSDLRIRNFDNLRNKLLLTNFEKNYLNGGRNFVYVDVDAIFEQLSNQDIMTIARTVAKRGVRIEYLYK